MPIRGKNKPDNSFGYQIRTTHRAFDRLLERQLQSHGLKNAHWYVLRVLWQKQGLSQRELCKEVNIMESTMVLILQKMQLAGLINRQKNQKDQRITNIFLTDKAEAMKAKLLPYANQLNKVASSGLSDDELAVFLKVIQTMKKNLLEADSDWLIK